MTVLVGYVHRPEAEHALLEAIKEARQRDVGLHVVHVLEHEVGESPTQVRREGSVADADEAKLEAIRERLTQHGIAVTTELVHSVRGRAADALLDQARSVDAELIVLGIRPRSKLEKLVLGSVAREVLLRADCPVLTVKAEDEVA